MSIVIDALRAAGAGEQIVVGAMLVVGAFYAWKATKVGRIVARVVSSGVSTAALVAVTVGVAIMLGWIDPQLGVVGDHVSTAGSAARDVIVEWLAERAREVLP